MTPVLPQLGLVLLGGAAGAICRAGLGLVAGRLGQPGWRGTLLANLLGSVLFGVLTVTVGLDDAEARALWLTGFCGALTTFSSYSLDVQTLRLSEPRHALAVWLGTPLVCLAGLWCGVQVAGWWS